MADKCLLIPKNEGAVPLNCINCCVVMSFQLCNGLQMFTEFAVLPETEGGSTQEMLNIREKCQTSSALN